MKKHLTTIAALVTAALTLTGPAGAAEGPTTAGLHPRSPLEPRELASGLFQCIARTVDPPVGTGSPRAVAGVEFIGTAPGLTDGGLAFVATIGVGEGAEEACETLAEQTTGMARELGCAAGPIDRSRASGANFTNVYWFFPLFCSGARGDIIDVMASLMHGLVATPSVNAAFESAGDVPARSLLLESLRRRFTLLESMDGGSRE